MVAAGLEPVVVDIATDWSPSGGYAAAPGLRPPTSEAVLCGNDELTPGFTGGLAAAPLHAPGDFSIVGTVDIPAAAYFSPPLTTIRLNFRELGAQGFRMLQAELRTGEPSPHRAVEPTSVVRASTSPPTPGAATSD